MIKLLCALLVTVAWSLSAQAVPYNSIPVGHCAEANGLSWQVWDVPPQSPDGLRSIVIQRGVGTPYLHEVLASPDPSGITFLSVLSPDPTQRAWIDWQGNLMVASMSGLQVSGLCGFAPAFWLPFYNHRPTAPPYPQMVNLLVGFGADNQPPPNSPANPTTQNPSFLQLPFGMMNEGSYLAAPVKITKPTAEMCLQPQGDPESFFDCIIENSTTARQAAAYHCAKSSTNQDDLALCLLEGNLGSNEKAVVQVVRKCYSEHGDNWDAYPVCMAGEKLDPNLQRLVSCTQQMAGSGQANYWALGTCAFGPQILAMLDPNPETMIAIQCAVQSGGEPTVFVGCTSGQLAVRELQKCLDHGIGGEKGCLGPNNSLSQAYDQVGDSIATAFGKKSAVYLAWQAFAVQQDPRKAAEAFTNARKEISKAHTQVAEEVKIGAKKAARSISDVAPRVTIGTPKVTIDFDDYVPW